MTSVDIGDRASPLDEIRFFLVNFQVFFPTDDILRNGDKDENAGIRLRVKHCRVGTERRADLCPDEMIRCPKYEVCCG